MNARPMLAKTRPGKHLFPTGSYAFMISAAELGLSLDPVLQIDHFHMAHATFRPHPHAGMSAVTYMFDDAETGFVNRDSLGERLIIRPGDLHWTQAGAGVMHEETPVEPGKWAHGLQIFVNLAARHKEAPPRVLHLDREDMPVIELGQGVRVVVAAGSLAGQASPINDGLLTRIHLWDIHLPAGAVARLDLEEIDLNGFALVLQGSCATVGGTLDAGEVGHFGRGVGGSVELSAAGAPTRAVLISGTPLDEPVLPKGPFVGNTPADVTRYIRRFQEGGMGQLDASF